MCIRDRDDEAAYILLGSENQTDIHYAMPVRNIIYDALQYGKQVADIAAVSYTHLDVYKRQWQIHNDDEPDCGTF